MKNSFILYTDYREKLSKLTLEEKGYIFDNILEYVNTKTTKKIPDKLIYVFEFIKNDLDNNEKKYLEKVDRIRENSKNNKSTRKETNRNDIEQIGGVNGVTNNNNTLNNNNNNIIKEFNKVGLAKVQTLSKSRETKLKARLKELSEEQIIQAIRKIPNSKFLMGQAKGDWKCSFDWLIDNDKNLLKVLEGNYDDNKSIAEQFLEEVENEES